MNSNQDLSTNILKSLTSVHLPPPPSSHAPLSEQQANQKHQPKTSATQHHAPQRSVGQSTRTVSPISKKNLPLQLPGKFQSETVSIRSSKTSPFEPRVPDYQIRLIPQDSSQSFQTPAAYKQTTPIHSSLPTSSPPIEFQVNDRPVGFEHTSFHPHVFSDPSTLMKHSGDHRSMLEPEIHVVPGQLIQPRVKRKSVSEGLPLPLTTPPHTVSRDTAGRQLKKNKIQETPTLHQGRTKGAKNPLSPQYSSPSQNIQSDADISTASISSTSSTKVTKPPQPSFTIPKASKKQLREQQREQKKMKQKEPEQFILPHPSKMPKIIHPDDSKPQYSYATLIGMAILRGDERKLTLSQIYNWISSTFSYYRRNDVGWQNSIRHNLSLNKAFIKTEKSIDGKGHYWQVAAGQEMQFVKGKTGKRSSGGISFDHTGGSSTLMSDSAAADERSESPVQMPELPARVELKSDEMTSEDEFSDEEMDDATKTPKTQIWVPEDDFIERPSLKKSHTAIGLQRFGIPKVEFGHVGDHDTHEETHKVPTKKQQLRSVSTGNGSLSKIPALEAPETNWAASALGERIIFGQVKPDFESPRSRLSSFPITSSFSCNTNFEMSPLKRQETGPLLEPLTPSSRVPSFTTSATLSTLSVPSTQQSHPSKTPLRNSSSSHQNVTNGHAGSASTQHIHNFLKTPTAKSRTPNPNTNSIMRKFWNSPAFVDDFYTSPSIPRHGDSQYHDTLFGSPDRRNKRQPFMENSGFNELFGVDISSVVKRAVESCSEKYNPTAVEAGADGDGFSTDDDMDGAAAI